MVTSSLKICPKISWEICFCCFKWGDTDTSPAQMSFLQLTYGQIFNDNITIQSSPRLFSSCFIPMLWIRITLMWIGMRIRIFDVSLWFGSRFKIFIYEDLDADPDPTIRPDTDTDPSFKKAESLEKVLKWAHIPYILAWHLQIDANPDPVSDAANKFRCGSAFFFDADADQNADPGYQNDAVPCGSGSTTLQFF